MLSSRPLSLSEKCPEWDSLYRSMELIFLLVFHPAQYVLGIATAERWHSLSSLCSLMASKVHFITWCGLQLRTAVGTYWVICNVAASFFFSFP